MLCARHFFVTISLDVTISVSYNWSVAVFTTSLESQESYLKLRNVTLQTCLSITQDFFRQHSTFARLYNAAASPALRLRSAGSLAIIILINFNEWEVCRRECCLRFTEGTHSIHTSDLDLKRTLLTRCTTYSFFLFNET